MANESKTFKPVPRTAGGLSKGEIFEVLQNERRRYVIQYLRHNEGPVALGDLATQVAAWEYEVEPDDISPDQRKRVYTTLQQTHLPRMDDAGIVAYDSDSGIIEATAQTDDLTVYLEIVPGTEFPWREYYLSIGAVSLAVVAVLWAGVYPFIVVDPIVWATLFSVILTVSAAYHTLLARELTLSEYQGSSGADAGGTDDTEGADESESGPAGESTDT